MTYYISVSDFQYYLKKHYLIYQHYASIDQLIPALIRQNALHTQISRPQLPDAGNVVSDTDFYALWDQQYLAFPELPHHPFSNLNSDLLFPAHRTIHALRQMRYLANGGLHTHDFFEIHYVFEGSCTFRFQEETHIMKKGDFCIVAPDSLHDLFVSDDNSIVVNLVIQKTAFQESFPELLTQDNLISLFFRSCFSAVHQPNYVLFSTGDDPGLRSLLKNLLLELFHLDDYSNVCAAHWLHLLFLSILRRSDLRIRYYNYQSSNDFPLILHYIQSHYRSLTLSGLAASFHYTEPYLSRLIRQNTGCTYSQLIKNHKLKEAKKYLAHTSLKVCDIAEQIGYRSTNHFSTVFHAETGMSPNQWRQMNAGR